MWFRRPSARPGGNVAFVAQAVASTGGETVVSGGPVCPPVVVVGGAGGGGGGVGVVAVGVEPPVPEGVPLPWPGRAEGRLATNVDLGGEAPVDAVPARWTT